MDCDIRGPYLPVGDTDWRCVTHDVDTVLREGATPPLGQRKNMRCPVGEPQ